MAAVKFSVVVPTRDRAATLVHTLRTCLDQSFDDYEIVVSDNDGSPSTRSAVDATASSKLKYVRTPSRLSMAASWEFAISHACGEYVIVIGDDDALLPHALAELDLLTRDSRTMAVRWEPAFYAWPSYPLEGQGNYLRIPILRGVREADGMIAAREVVAFRAPPESLPSIYHGAVHRDVLESLRRKTGRVFQHRFPAIYSGFAIASQASRFLAVDAPMSISGRSDSSFTVPRPYRRERTPAAEEFRSLNAREGLQPDARVPDLPVFPHAAVADAFFAAKRAHFPDSELDVNRRQLAAGCVSNLRAATEVDWREGLKAVRDSLVDDAESLAWFEGGLGKSPFRKAPPPRVRAARLGFDESHLHLDTSGFGVADVVAASVLCERMLNYRSGVRHDNRARTPAEEIAELRLASVRQQQVVEDLNRICDERLAAIRRLTRQRGLFFRLGTWVKSHLGARSGV